MLLTSSDPHDDFTVKILGGRIIIWTMDLPYHRCVLIKAAVGGRVALYLGPIIRVVIDIGRRLALVGHSKCFEEGARLATM
jgi:hypothetical protein